MNLVYFIQIGATVTSKSLLKVKTRRCTNNFWAHCISCVFLWSLLRIHLIAGLPLPLPSTPSHSIGMSLLVCFASRLSSTLFTYSFISFVFDKFSYTLNLAIVSKFYRLLCILSNKYLNIVLIFENKNHCLYQFLPYVKVSTQPYLAESWLEAIFLWSHITACLQSFLFFLIMMNSIELTHSLRLISQVIRNDRIYYLNEIF